MRGRNVKPALHPQLTGIACCALAILVFRSFSVVYSTVVSSCGWTDTLFAKFWFAGRLVRLGNVCGCQRGLANHFFGGVLLCGSTGTVFGPGFGASGFFLGTGEGVDLLCGLTGTVFFVMAIKI